MDLTDSIAPTSDQLDAVDLLGGPRTFTIEKVGTGTPEQPINIKLSEFPRVWRPSKSMRRVLVAAWGKDSAAYIGRRLTLFCDPDVMFGKEKVGGTRISHLSHIDKRLSVPLLVTRGKSATYTVEPLTEPTRPAEPSADDVAACTDVDALRTMYKAASTNVKTLIMERVAELNTPADGPMIPSAS